MRVRLRRWLTSATATALVVALSACGPPGEPEAGGDAEAGTTASAEATFDPGPIPDASGAVALPAAQRGDCPVDPSTPGVITFVVTSDDDSTPVEVTYPVFRTDGTRQVRRMTQPGPVIAVLQADCTDGVTDGPWGFVAEAGTGSLACALFFGGKLVASDSAFAEGAADEGVRADCTGHPGM